MDSYIVRIYQREDTRLVGVVETAEEEGRALVFHDAGELWRILTGGHPDNDNSHTGDLPSTDSE